MVAKMWMFQARASSVIAAAVLLLPWVLLMIAVIVLAIASLVVPDRQWCQIAVSAISSPSVPSPRRA